MGPVRVAIVGGGCAGVAAAWELSKHDDYKVHLFEQSERLGGKGTSVRSGRDGRILEHGLHVWFGFYENAFRMMRECYAEVGKRGWGPDKEEPDRRLAHGRFDDAFFPEPNIGVMQDRPDGNWVAWSGLFLPEPGAPGEPLDESSNPFTLANYMLRCISLLRTLVLSVVERPGDGVPGDPRPDERSKTDEALDLDVGLGGMTSAELLIDRAAGLLRSGSLASASVLLQGIRVLESWLKNQDFAPQVVDSAVQLGVAIATQARRLLSDVVSVDPDLRMRAEIIDLVLTIFVGVFRHRLLWDDRGFDAINHYDYREWLLDNGASRSLLESPFLTGIYDLVFAYEDGNRSRPQLAAGVALRGALRMFLTYRGAMFWRMRSGMGECVFAPLYKVLAGDDETRRVRFHFLHRLRRVDFARGQDDLFRVAALHFDVPGAGNEVETLEQKALDDFGCWPATDGARALQPGREFTEFDAVVFAMGVDDLRTVWEASESSKHLPDCWNQMFASTKTVATQSAQVWLKEELDRLGWRRGAGIVTALGLSFDTWADMTHTLATEREWRAAVKGGSPGPLDEARSVAYFCATLPEADVTRALREEKNNQARVEQRLRTEVERRFDRMLHEEIHRIWPRAPAGTPGATLRRLGLQVQAEADGTRHRGKKAAADLEASLERMIRAAIKQASEQALGRLIYQMQAESRGTLRRGGGDAVAHLERHLERTIREAVERAGEGAVRRLVPWLQAEVEQARVAEEDAAADLERRLERRMREEIEQAWSGTPAKTQHAALCRVEHHVQANFAASGRYTLSLPGSLADRISPLKRCFENATVAGDWTACGLDVGCIEAAVMSGMLAAHAISGEPRLESIVGFDHP